MTDFLTALGLMFLIEGSLYALFPDQMKRMMRQALSLEAPSFRSFGLGFAILGFLILTLARNH